jgi:hypothetical protein
MVKIPPLSKGDFYEPLFFDKCAVTTTKKDSVFLEQGVTQPSADGCAPDSSWQRWATLENLTPRVAQAQPPNPDIA